MRAASPLSAQLCIRLRLPSSAHRATHSICRAIDPTSSTSTYITFTAAELAGDGAREERAASDRVMDGAGASTVEPPTKPIAAQPVEPTAPPSPRRRRKKKVTLCPLPLCTCCQPVGSSLLRGIPCSGQECGQCCPRISQPLTRGMGLQAPSDSGQQWSAYMLATSLTQQPGADANATAATLDDAHAKAPLRPGQVCVPTSSIPG